MCSLSQFLVAPYSLFVSFALAIALIPPLYASHYFVYYGIRDVVTIRKHKGLNAE
jgi:hypothetical protein